MTKTKSPAKRGRTTHARGQGRDLRMTVDAFERALAKRGVALKRADLVGVLADAGSLRDPNALAALAADGGLAPTVLVPSGVVTLADGTELVAGRDAAGNVLALGAAFAAANRHVPSPFGGILDLGGLVSAAGVAPVPVAPAPARSTDRPRVTAWVAMVEHRHGVNAYTAYTEAEVRDQVFDYVMENWDQEARNHEDLGSHEGLTDQEAVERYFEVVSDESYLVQESQMGGVVDVGALRGRAAESGPTLGEPPEGVRVTATYTPQAWVNDHAVDVDPDGETEWDATDAFRGMSIAAARRHLRQGVDTDELAVHASAPQWVRDRQGPFSLRLEGLEAWIAAAEAAAAASDGDDGEDAFDEAAETAALDRYHDQNQVEIAHIAESIETLGAKPEHLDELVHDAAANLSPRAEDWASRINNEGLERQVAFILRENGRIEGRGLIERAVSEDLDA